MNDRKSTKWFEAEDLPRAVIDVNGSLWVKSIKTDTYSIPLDGEEFAPFATACSLENNCGPCTPLDPGFIAKHADDYELKINRSILQEMILNYIASCLEPVSTNMLDPERAMTEATFSGEDAKCWLRLNGLNKNITELLLVPITGKEQENE